VCVETGTCTSDEECTDGLTCDEERATCEPPEEVDPGSCAGEVTCDTLPPVCLEDETPGIRDGCFTGVCIPIVDCDVPPPPTCEDIEDELACVDRRECITVYAGINCTCGVGCTCTGSEAGCTCESFEFAGCEPENGG
jgi:hypothetical protein